MSNQFDIKKFMDLIERASDSQEAAAFVHVGPFAQRLMDDPKKAIGDIFNVYNKALDDAYTNENGNNVRSFIQAISGGPEETVPLQLYNAVGAVYPYLDRSLKDQALDRILSILDGINYVYVQEIHTSGIREPQLLSDISIKRAMYWPGLDEGKYHLNEYPDFFELQKELIDERGIFDKSKVYSDFVVAYSLLRSDFCDYGERYSKLADPNFLDRTLKGIVAMRFATMHTNEGVSNGMQRLRELLPESLHDKIEPIRQEGGWVDHILFP